MKKIIITIIVYFVSAYLHAATINIFVHNTNNNLVRNAKVILYNSNGNAYPPQYTNASGLATFALLNYGIYNYEVYYNSGETEEFWGDIRNINLNSPLTTSNFIRDWPIRYSENISVLNPIINQQVTFQIIVKNNLNFSRNVYVKLWVNKDRSNTGFQSSTIQSISGNSTKTFTLNFTPTSSGTYYFKIWYYTYNDGAQKYIVTDTYAWATAFTAIQQKGDILITVHNTDNNLVQNAKVVLYNNSNGNSYPSQYTNTSGKATFTSLDYGNYHYEVYYSGGETEEFWGDMQNVQLNSSTISSNFIRNWPIRHSENISTTKPIINQPVTFEITVKNNLNFSRNVYVKLWVSKDRSNSDYQSSSMLTITFFVSSLLTWPVGT